MALKLTIDQGNSAAKAAVWRGDTIVGDTVCRRLTPEVIARLADGAGGRFDASILSSVCDADPAVSAAMASCSGRFVALDAGTPLPISIGYTTPASLGRDRIAAVTGAWSQWPGEWVLVVDCGTAVTYDLLSPDGVFAGGNIAPGIAMRLEALNRFTARLPLASPSGDTLDWATDTELALRSGAVNGVLAELDYYRRRVPSPECRVVLTGGSAPLVASRAAVPADFDPSLVAKGLKCILDYNENI